MSSLRGLCLLLLAVSLGGCNNDRIEKLERQNQELMGELKRDRAASDYDLQAKCARDSKVWFSENWQADKTTLLLNYTDHYNKRLTSASSRLSIITNWSATRGLTT